MKNVYGMILVSMLLLVTGCAQKVNDPADLEAIKNLLVEFDKAVSAGDADLLVSAYYADDVVRMPPNQAAVTGKDGVQSWIQPWFDLYKAENKNIVEDVHVNGDLAAARGSWASTNTLKEGGTVYSGRGKWAAAFERQADGTWKTIFDIYNSDLPAIEDPPLGKDEQALLKINHEWAEASIRNDIEWMENILAEEFVHNLDGTIKSRSQYISDARPGITKTESASASDQKVVVFGDTAVVHGIWTDKSTTRGRDSGGKFRYTDIYVKRNGRWKCVSVYSTKVS